MNKHARPLSDTGEKIIPAIPASHDYERLTEEDFLASDINVLLLGSGGRESAMADGIARSYRCAELYIAPGNAGTTAYGINAALDISDFSAVERFAHEHDINLIVVGPEVPLVAGIVDYFRRPHLRHIRVVGPGARGACLEGSKDFSKEFMQRHNIPTAAYRSFTAEKSNDAKAFLDTLQAPYVIKVDGLAAGKGVLILDTKAEAEKSLDEVFAGKFGSAGSKVVIEAFLHGIECSVFVATDGIDYVLLPEAKDYKRIGDGDTGPNTGGMGAVSPVSFFDKAFAQKVEDRIIRPTVKGLQQEGISYTGFIFFGLMNVGGEPYVIEYNCRLGDPEAEAVIPRIKSDFLDLLCAIPAKRIREYSLQIDPRSVVSLMLVAGGYPGDYERGKEITLPAPSEDALLFHAGTKAATAGKIVTNGGRVLAVTAFGATRDAAKRRAYTIASQVLFTGKNYRHDIGDDL